MPDSDTIQLRNAALTGKEGLLLLLSERNTLYRALQRALPTYEMRKVQGVEAASVATLVKERAGRPIIAVVDWRLGEAAGWLVEWRSAPFPVFAFCDDQVANHVAALVAGADSIIEPPVSPAMIQALHVAYYRKWALVHRHVEGKEGQDAVTREGRGERPGARSPVSHGTEAGEFIQAGTLLLDRVNRRVWIEGDLQKFPPRPFDLLLYLVERKGACCTREEILHDVWGLDFDPTTNVVDVQVYALRNLLKPHGLDGIIRTERGRGYFFHPLP